MAQACFIGCPVGNFEPCRVGRLTIGGGAVCAGVSVFRRVKSQRGCCGAGRTRRRGAVSREVCSVASGVCMGRVCCL